MNKVINCFIITLLVLSAFSMYAQKEANIWYFGENAGLDFNSGTPVALTDGQLNTFEGCSAISDKNGNLLFYTNGVTVYNKNHEIMLNGTRLKGDSSSTHSAIIVPRPEHPNIYYIFTLDEETGPNGLQYSEVDMLLDGGLGAVTSNKNILIETPFTEKITAVKHAFENSYWVVGHRWNNNEFVAYKVSATGINTTPVVSAIGSLVSGRKTEAAGQIKISPNGKKLAVANYFKGFELYDFDNNTGQLSNPILLSSDLFSYGVEFSPNSKFLYTSTVKEVSQYSLNEASNSDIINSKLIILLTINLKFYSGALQLAPDGKIYVALFGKQSLDVINNPNIKGLGCNFQEGAVSLGSGTSLAGLPTFIQSFFSLDEINYENICFGNTTIFSLTDTVDTVVWDFGDPPGTNNTSSDTNATHIFSSPGTYTVSATATVGTETVTESIDVTIYNPPTVTPTVTLIQCDDDLDGFSSFNLNEVIPEITTNTINQTISFFESLQGADTNNGAITNLTAYTNKTSGTDTLWARVENSNACYSISQVNLRVTTTQIPSAFIRDFYACDDVLGGYELDGISLFDFSSIHSEIEAMFPVGQQLNIKYYQNETDALSEINPISDISNYVNTDYPYFQQIFVRVDSAINNDCLGLGAHINLHVQTVPDFTVDETPQSVCLFDPTFALTLDPQEHDTTKTYLYQWTDEAGSLLSNERTLTVSVPGEYYITLTDIFGANCFRTKSFSVNASQVATITIEDITVVDNTTNNTITINTDNLGLGTYEFALNTEFSNYQDQPFFENVSSGIHTLYVRDKKGCGTASIEISVIGYPKFFTPNGDGNNDYWHIKGINDQFQTNSDIFIYDRYGKLLKQLVTASNGWDGTFKGSVLPNDDYWFTVRLQDGRSFNGHFTLKR